MTRIVHEQARTYALKADPYHVFLEFLFPLRMALFYGESRMRHSPQHLIMTRLGSYDLNMSSQFRHQLQFLICKVRPLDQKVELCYTIFRL
jgi:hypothetical protein